MLLMTAYRCTNLADLSFEQMLDAHLPAAYFESEELDLRNGMWARWQDLAQLAEDTSDQLAEVQGPFKRILNRDIKEFVKVFQSPD